MPWQKGGLTLHQMTKFYTTYNIKSMYRSQNKCESNLEVCYGMSGKHCG